MPLLKVLMLFFIVSAWGPYVEARSPLSRSPTTPVPFAETILPFALSATNSLLLECRNLDFVPLAKALVNAHQKGLKVEVVVSKQIDGNPVPKFLKEHGVSVFLDSKDKLPANTILIADGKVHSSESWLFHLGQKGLERAAEKDWEFHRSHSERF
jgi:hypothetical protein